MAGKNLFSRHGKGDLGLALAPALHGQRSGKTGGRSHPQSSQRRKASKTASKVVVGSFLGKGAGEVGVSMREREG